MLCDGRQSTSSFLRSPHYGTITESEDVRVHTPRVEISTFSLWVVSSPSPPPLTHHGGLGLFLVLNDEH